MSKKDNRSSAYPLWVRILSIALAAVTASGVLAYLVMFIIGLFG